MIYSSLNCDLKLPGYPAIINEALEYLKATDFTKMEPGTYEIKGRQLFAMIFDIETKEISETRPETHEKYLDIQHLITGEEAIGVVNYKDSFEIDEKVPENDLIFYKDVPNETFIKMSPQDFCVLFPSDVHIPGVCFEKPMKIRKVVVKISIDLL